MEGSQKCKSPAVAAGDGRSCRRTRSEGRRVLRREITMIHILFWDDEENSWLTGVDWLSQSFPSQISGPVSGSLKVIRHVTCCRYEDELKNKLFNKIINFSRNFFFKSYRYRVYGINNLCSLPKLALR